MTDSTLQAKNFFCILSRAARCIKAFLDVKACLLALKEAAWNSIGHVVKAFSRETCNISVEPSEIIGTCGKLADEPWLRHGSACKNSSNNTTLQETLMQTEVDRVQSWWYATGCIQLDPTRSN